MALLTLTNDECDTLYILLSNIGGDPNRSKRKHMNTMKAKLEAVMRKYRGEIFSFATSFEDNFYITEGNRMYWNDEVTEPIADESPPARHPDDPIGYTVVECDVNNAPCDKCEYVKQGNCDTAPCYIHQRQDKKSIYYVLNKDPK